MARSVAAPLGPRAVESPARRRSRAALSTVMVGAGILHFVIPDTYASIVPGALGNARTLVFVSGAAEVAAGVLLARTTTRRLGAWCTVGVLVAVFPANVQMALDARPGGGQGWTTSELVAWLRLPLQVPLVLWALSHARR